MSGPMFDFGRTKWMDVEANVFAMLAVAIAFESADLVEGDPEVRAAEGFILIEFEAVLVVEVQGPEFTEGHGEIDFICGIQPGKDGVGGFDEAADAFRIAR